MTRLPPPRLALNREQAAAALGISPTTWDKEVAPFLQRVHIGRRRLFPVAEVERWLRENSQAAPAEEARRAG